MPFLLSLTPKSMILAINATQVTINLINKSGIEPIYSTPLIFLSVTPKSSILAIHARKGN